MGYAESTAYCTACIDDLIVFAIFLVVCPPLPQSASSLIGYYRTGICRWHISSGYCIVSEIAIYTFARNQPLSPRPRSGF